VRKNDRLAIEMLRLFICVSYFSFTQPVSLLILREFYPHSRMGGVRWQCSKLSIALVESMVCRRFPRCFHLSNF
jgi:hypothetical protein